MIIVMSIQNTRGKGVFKTRNDEMELQVKVKVEYGSL